MKAFFSLKVFHFDAFSKEKSFELTLIELTVLGIVFVTSILNFGIDG